MHLTDADLMQNGQIECQIGEGSIDQQGLQPMKDSSLLSLKSSLFFIISQKKTKQSIGSSAGITLTIIYSKIVYKKLLGRAHLITAQNFYIHETTKVIMIDEYEKFVVVAFKIVSLYFKDFNNGQNLTIVSFILYFSWNHFSGEIGY